MARLALLAGLFLILPVPVSAHEGAGVSPSDPMPNVLDLSVADFDSTVTRENDWLVQFYAPWCTHCQELAPVWAEVADTLQKAEGSPIRVAKFDVTQRGTGSISERYEVTGFPTIVLIGGDGSVHRFKGHQRSLEALLDFVRAASGAAVPKAEEPGLMVVPGKVTVLTAATADELIHDKTKHVFVKFYAPWCGHCRAMEYDYEVLAKRVADADVVIAKLDAAEHHEIGRQYEIASYPTLILYLKDKKAGIPYFGDRKADAMLQFLSDQIGADSQG
eukprot:TRINITY_DN8769_c1_g1_i1.p1 TRINITY_DN8769_c1_g1~~TRINITY_DN8769_c1_g1_i1.p1  ORF type:complete len:275 (+),score=76.32 TRINITY_DN8769_c1_g1_i1:208-1032(+)